MSVSVDGCTVEEGRATIAPFWERWSGDQGDEGDADDVTPGKHQADGTGSAVENDVDVNVEDRSILSSGNCRSVGRHKRRFGHEFYSSARVETPNQQQKRTNSRAGGPVDSDDELSGESGDGRGTHSRDRRSDDSRQHGRGSGPKDSPMSRSMRQNGRPRDSTDEGLASGDGSSGDGSSGESDNGEDAGRGRDNGRHGALANSVLRSKDAGGSAGYIRSVVRGLRNGQVRRPALEDGGDDRGDHDGFGRDRWQRRAQGGVDPRASAAATEAALDSGRSCREGASGGGWKGVGDSTPAPQPRFGERIVGGGGSLRRESSQACREGAGGSAWKGITASAGNAGGGAVLKEKKKVAPAVAQAQGVPKVAKSGTKGSSKVGGQVKERAREGGQRSAQQQQQQQKQQQQPPQPQQQPKKKLLGQDAARKPQDAGETDRDEVRQKASDVAVVVEEEKQEQESEPEPSLKDLLAKAKETCSMHAFWKRERPMLESMAKEERGRPPTPPRPKDRYREALERMAELDEPSTSEPFIHRCPPIQIPPVLPHGAPVGRGSCTAAIPTLGSDEDGLTHQERLRLRQQQQLQQLEQLQLKGQRKLREASGVRQDAQLAHLEGRIRRGMDLRGRFLHTHTLRDSVECAKGALRERLLNWAKDIPYFVALGGNVDRASQDMAVDIHRSRATPGPTEWEAWAGTSLDSWEGFLPVTAELVSHDGARSTGQPRQSVTQDRVVDLTAVSRGEGGSSCASPVLRASAATASSVSSAMPSDGRAATVGPPAGAGAGAGVPPHGVSAARGAGGRRLSHGAFQRSAETARAGKKCADESWVMGRLATQGHKDHQSGRDRGGKRASGGKEAWSVSASQSPEDASAHRQLRDAMEKRIQEEWEREDERTREEESTRAAHERLLKTLPKGWKVNRRRPDKGEVSLNGDPFVYFYCCKRAGAVRFRYRHEVEAFMKSDHPHAAHFKPGVARPWTVKDNPAPDPYRAMERMAVAARKSHESVGQAAAPAASKSGESINGALASATRGGLGVKEGAAAPALVTVASAALTGVPKVSVRPPRLPGRAAGEGKVVNDANALKDVNASSLSSTRSDNTRSISFTSNGGGASVGVVSGHSRSDVDDDLRVDIEVQDEKDQEVETHEVGVESLDVVTDDESAMWLSAKGKGKASGEEKAGEKPKVGDVEQRRSRSEARVETRNVSSLGESLVSRSMFGGSPAPNKSSVIKRTVETSGEEWASVSGGVESPRADLATESPVGSEGAAERARQAWANENSDSNFSAESDGDVVVVSPPWSSADSESTRVVKSPGVGEALLTAKRPSLALAQSGSPVPAKSRSPTITAKSPSPVGGTLPSLTKENIRKIGLGSKPKVSSKKTAVGGQSGLSSKRREGASIVPGSAAKKFTSPSGVKKTQANKTQANKTKQGAQGANLIDSGSGILPFPESLRGVSAASLGAAPKKARGRSVGSTSKPSSATSATSAASAASQESLSKKRKEPSRPAGKSPQAKTGISGVVASPALSTSSVSSVISTTSASSNGSAEHAAKKRKGATRSVIPTSQGKEGGAVDPSGVSAEEAPAKKRGRPMGSGNKTPSSSSSNVSSSSPPPEAGKTGSSDVEPAAVTISDILESVITTSEGGLNQSLSVKRGRGRPLGSKNLRPYGCVSGKNASTADKKRRKTTGVDASETTRTPIVLTNGPRPPSSGSNSSASSSGSGASSKAPKNSAPALPPLKSRVVGAKAKNSGTSAASASGDQSAQPQQPLRQSSRAAAAAATVALTEVFASRSNIGSSSSVDAGSRSGRNAAVVAGGNNEG